MSALPIVLIPGAWMGAWIWDDTVQRLGRAGFRAQTLTLPGLDAGSAESEVSAVRLQDHVACVLSAVQAFDEPVMVVGHSYSGLLAGLVADQAPDLVAHTIIVAGFFPRDGRCLLDDWGADEKERAAEREAIERAGMIWAPPAEGLSADPGLTGEQARWLGERLQPHPGRTVLDPAVMRRPITERSVTVLANVGSGDPLSTLPDDLADADLSAWKFRSIPEGHWPMLGHPTLLVGALIEAAKTALETSRT